MSSFLIHSTKNYLSYNIRKSKYISHNHHAETYHANSVLKDVHKGRKGLAHILDSQKVANRVISAPNAPARKYTRAQNLSNLRIRPADVELLSDSSSESKYATIDPLL